MENSDVIKSNRIPRDLRTPMNAAGKVIMVLIDCHDFLWTTHSGKTSEEAETIFFDFFGGLSKDENISGDILENEFLHVDNESRV